MAEEIEELKRQLALAENERLAAEKSLAVIQSVFQTAMDKVIPHQRTTRRMLLALKSAENRLGGTQIYSKVSVSWGW